MSHQHGRAILVLEGLDKCGKSTTAGELATKLLAFGPVQLLHFGKPDGDQFREYLEALRQADAFDGSTIIDRLHWSEEAYGRTYRPKQVLETESIDALDEVLRNMGGVVIWKQRELAEVGRALDADDHATKGSPVSLDDLAAISKVFARRFTRKRVASTTSDFRLAVHKRVLNLAADLRTESLELKEAGLAA